MPDYQDTIAELEMEIQRQAIMLEAYQKIHDEACLALAKDKKTLKRWDKYISEANEAV